MKQSLCRVGAADAVKIKTNASQLPANATACTVPAGIFEACDMAMGMQIVVTSRSATDKFTKK